MGIRHKLGDRVIAITSSIKNTKVQKRKRGEVYIVKEVMYCNMCSTQFVNIGEVSENGNILCGCGESQYNGQRKWTYSKHFIPITKYFLKKMESEEDYEICASLKKELDKVEKII